ncbi:MAG TPA: hypothetical protein VMN57_05540, partial [Anaerolineales bacterium]|nr:hypothetical protein [Anaerolineales bacterium]
MNRLPASNRDRTGRPGRATTGPDLSEPTRRLLLTPTYLDARRHFRAGLDALRRTDPLHPAAVLLPGTEALQDLRRSLGDALGVRLYTFYDLAAAVLDAGGFPVHRLEDIALRRLLRRVLDDLAAAGSLAVFAPLREKPGFLGAVLDWLREMESQGITPEDGAVHAAAVHAAAAHADEEIARALAEIYTQYETELRDRAAADADGSLRLAAGALESDPAVFRMPGRLAVLGFDQFNPLQRRLLRALASRCDDVAVYLAWDPDRPETSLAHARAAETRRTLLADLPLVEEIVPRSDEADPTLARLHRDLFENRDQGPPPDAGGSLRLVEAPSREVEVRFVLREVKKLLLAGEDPAEIAVLAPEPAVYHPIVRAVAGEYGLPIALDR